VRDAYEPTKQIQKNLLTSEQRKRLEAAVKINDESFRAGEDLENGDVDAAIPLLEKCARKGNTFSMYILGDAYYSGRLVPKDYKKALYWLKRCADHGPSEYHVIMDIVDICRSEAMGKLGNMYLNAMGVDQDLEEAEKWLKAGAEGLDPHSMNNYAIFLQRFRKDQGVEEEMLKWWKIAAESGYSVAMLNLAERYEKGIGTEKNLDLAEKWMRKAVATGQASAAGVLGHFLRRTGRGNSKDDIRMLEGAFGEEDTKDALALCIMAEILLDEAGEDRKRQTVTAPRIAHEDMLMEKEEKAINLIRKAEASCPQLGKSRAKE
jgi:TPR repeat protein